MGNTRRKSPLPLVWVLLVALAIALLGYAGCRYGVRHFFGGVDMIVRELPSPGQQFKAVVVEHDAAATGTWSYAVKVVPADADPGIDRGYPSGACPVVEWDGKRSLTVRVPDPSTFTGVENECPEVSYTLAR